jgi:hypothetical protein
MPRIDEDYQRIGSNRRGVGVMAGRRSSSRGQVGRTQGKSRRGFAAMSSELQRQIARKGGQASARVQRRDEFGQFNGGKGKGRSSSRQQARGGARTSSRASGRGGFARAGAGSRRSSR